MRIDNYLVLMVVGGLFALQACTKDVISTNDAKDPYRDTVVPAVRLSRAKVMPAQGEVGDTVMVFGSGFAKHQDKLAILFNGQQATILSVTDSTATVKVPELASTGNISAQVEQEYSFGPDFRVFGPMKVDLDYPSVRGANNTIQDIIALDGEQFLIVGDFDDYDNSNLHINRVARINADGTFDRNFQFGENTGSRSTISKAVAMGDGKYLVAGSFGAYDEYSFVNSIARLNHDGSLDTMTVHRPSGDTVETSALKGGISGSVNGLQVQADGKIIVTGFFRYYVSPDYSLSSINGRDSLHLDSTLVNFLARLNPDGTLDKTYNFDAVQDHGKESVNGAIYASALLPDGKLLIAGDFTKYNGQSVNRIARLNTDGTLDAGFSPGSGADQEILGIAVQPDGKYILTGTFNSYNGKPAAHVVRINADGAIDPSFSVGEGPDGFVLTAGVLPGGEILLSGNFLKFNGIARRGFVVLNPDGTLHKKYNTNGGITKGGLISKFLPLPSTADSSAFFAVGAFTEFDNYPNNRIVKMIYK